MSPLPRSLAWLKGEPTQCNAQDINQHDPEKDTCLQRVLKDGISQIKIEDLRQDPHYIVFPDEIPYEDVMYKFNKLFSTNGKQVQWNKSPWASYYTMGHDKNCTAWNYRDSEKQRRPSCVQYDTYKPIVAHRDLPPGTVVRIEIDPAFYVEKKCSAFKDTDSCFKQYPTILEKARELANYLEGSLAVVGDRGPYVMTGKRDFDLSKLCMYLTAGDIGFKTGEIPIKVTIIALPRRAMQESALHFLTTTPKTK